MTISLSRSLVALGFILATGCGTPCRSGTWCEGDVVYQCGTGHIGRADADVPQGIEDCRLANGECRELVPNEAYCVVPNESCDDASSVCFEGNAHACVESRIVLEPAAVCTEDETCATHDGTRASCGIEDGSGGAGGAGGASG